MLCYSNIQITFREKTYVRDLSLTVGERDLVLLSGRSGCGKSTLLNLALGFVRPAGGTVSFRGRPLDQKTVWQARTQIAYVNQDTQIGSGTVRTLIEQYFGFRNNRHRQLTPPQLNETCALFSLDPAVVLDQAVSELSGGERQRVALVIAWLLGRNIFFLDEPTAALDGDLKETVARAFAGRQDTTTVVISHDEAWYRLPGVKVFDVEEERWM